MIAKTDGPTVPVEYDLEEVMRELIDEAFLPVVGPDKEFLGIITRKSILKAVNALVHNFHLEEK
ncbi:CBS domain [Chlamydia trachomatis]|nr:CBS domain [Chlamydia trachomatis]